MSKPVKKYSDVMESGIFSEREIINFRKYLNNTKNKESYEILLDKFEQLAPFKLHTEQQKKGINYLRRKLFKANGNLRKGADKFSSKAIDIINNYDRFEFVGLHYINSYVYPAYRCYSTDGRYFDYLGVSFEFTRELY